MNVRAGFSDAKRVMIKVGSNVLTNERGRLSIGRIGHIVEQIATLVSQQGKEVILVSSGAVAVGRRRLEFQRRLSQSLLQTDHNVQSGQRAAASAGQAAFMALYDQMFAQFDLIVGNVLLTHADLSSPSHIKTFSSTINELLSCGIVPVLNENDVTNQKLDNMPAWFVDNDSLSAKLATDLDAQLLLLLTDVDGLYTGPPGVRGSYKLDYYSPAIDAITYGEKSSRGRGGMESKIRAASLASQRGVDVVVANGFENNVIERVFEGEVLGTVFTEKWEMQALTARQVCLMASSVTKELGQISGDVRTQNLRDLANALLQNKAAILKAHASDCSVDDLGGDEEAPTPLSAESIEAIANSFEVLAQIEDPLGKVVVNRLITGGLELQKRTTSLGVVLVVGDLVEDLLQAIALAVRTGNSLLYYNVGGKSTSTNDYIIKLVRQTLGKNWPTDAIQHVGKEVDLTRLVSHKDFIDLILPRGDSKLTKTLRETTNIPILGVTESVCHVYVDKECEVKKAIEVILDSKSKDVDVGCNRGASTARAKFNALDTLLVHEDLAKDGRMLEIIRALRDAKIGTLGGPRASENLGLTEAPSLSAEWGQEQVITIELVSSVEGAVSHVNTHGSFLADGIVTESDEAAEYFLSNVDSACVMKNASTRFCDGYRLGIGAETGVSTQRVNSGRGPVGVTGLLSSRWIVNSASCHTTAQEAAGKWQYLHENITKESEKAPKAKAKAASA